MVDHFYNNIFLRFYHAHPAFFSIFLVATGYLMLNVTDALNKFFMSDYTAFELMFWSSTASTLTMLGLAKISGFKKSVTSRQWKLHIIRGFLVVVNIALALTALRYMELANFYAIVFLSPITCVICGRLFFGDALSFAKLAAVCCGFMGILIVVQPNNIEMNIGVIACLGMVMTCPASLLLVRKMGKDEPKLIFGLSASAVIMVTSFFCIIFSTGFSLPSLAPLSLFALIGFMGCIVGTFITTGFQLAPNTSTVAPFHYIQILGGIVIGYFVWGDIPTYMTLIGGSIVIMSGLWIMLQEKQAASVLKTIPLKTAKAL